MCVCVCVRERERERESESENLIIKCLFVYEMSCEKKKNGKREQAKITKRVDVIRATLLHK